MTATAALRTAAVLLWVNGVGFGVFTIPAMRNLLAGDDVPIVMGFKAYFSVPNAVTTAGWSSTRPTITGTPSTARATATSAFTVGMPDPTWDTTIFGPFVLARLTIAVWMLMFGALGIALLRPTTSAGTAPLVTAGASTT